MLCVSSLYMCAFSPAIVLVCAHCRWRWPWAVQSSSCSPWWAVRCTTPSPTQPTRSGWTELSSQVLHQGGGRGEGGGWSHWGRCHSLTAASILRSVEQCVPGLQCLSPPAAALWTLLYGGRRVLLVPKGEDCHNLFTLGAPPTPVAPPFPRACGPRCMSLQWLWF